MKTHRSLAVLALMFAAALCGMAADLSFPLPGLPLEVATNEEKFRPFAEKVAAGVEEQLGVPALVDDPATLKLLLSSRVHLAPHFADNDKAIATAAWIRSLQTAPAEKAFAGLTTLAAVAARRQHPGAEPGEAPYRETFRREFSRQLASLPRTPEIVAMLRGQLDKIAGLTEASLLKEVGEVIAPAIARRGFCGVKEADDLVRVRHRLVSILPVKKETLEALKSAIAARTSP
ncbi:MAG: hypothetical protein JNN01_08670 [Opitutaceae bacterium]|nr:hypothetical protein [Opitutaceae bacterium]